MAALGPFLPMVAALSGHAGAMQQSGLVDDAIEGRLVAMLSAPEDAPASGAAAGAEAPPPAPPPTATDPALLTEDGALDADETLMDGRRRPGAPKRLPDRVHQENIGAVRAPPPEAFPGDPDFPVPDRWRLSETLGLARKEHFLDPYNQNTYKGDRPICVNSPEEKERRRKDGVRKCWTPGFLGLSPDHWFLALNATSDTVIEPRSFPTPVGVQTTSRPGSNDTFGRASSLLASQTFLFGASLIKGSTAYKPPEIEYRIAVAINANYALVNERRILSVDPSKAPHRFDHFVGVQEAFVDYHIRNVSDHYDFDSVRIGIQPFQADFRGFLFNDQQLGIRLFGNRDNNRFQYNLAAFWRLHKETNSGLNDLRKRPRDDVVLHANLYRQDFPFVGLTSQISATVNLNYEGNDLVVDSNGFPVIPALIGNLRPRNYNVTYLGYSVDGHIGRVNLTASAYAAVGKDNNSIFTTKPAKIRSFFFAAEPSMDFNWVRVRLSGLYAQGDHNPYDNVEGGFDAIFENPVFAGADTSYWIRQVIPFAGGGRAVGINGRNGILNSLRSSKEQGQSNFNNPGTILLGAGADFDVTPTVRISANVNHLWFENTSSLQALRNEGSIPRSIGWDISTAATWRPKAIQNVVFRLSGAALSPGKGFSDLFAASPRDKRYYSVLFNAIVSF